MEVCFLNITIITLNSLVLINIWKNEGTSLALEGGDTIKFFQRAKFFFGQGFDDYIQRFLAGEDVPDMTYPGRVDSQTAMKYTAVFACVRVLAEALAGTPVMLYRKKENGDRETRNDLAVYDILHNQPNEGMSPFNYKETCMVSLNLGSNSVSQKLVNKYGDLVGLYPMSSG